MVQPKPLAGCVDLATTCPSFFPFLSKIFPNHDDPFLPILLFPIPFLTILLLSLLHSYTFHLYEACSMRDRWMYEVLFIGVVSTSPLGLPDTTDQEEVHLDGLLVQLQGQQLVLRLLANWLLVSWLRLPDVYRSPRSC